MPSAIESVLVSDRGYLLERLASTTDFVGSGSIFGVLAMMMGTSY